MISHPVHLVISTIVLRSVSKEYIRIKKDKQKSHTIERASDGRRRWWIDRYDTTMGRRNVYWRLMTPNSVVSQSHPISAVYRRQEGRETRLIAVESE